MSQDNCDVSTEHPLKYATAKVILIGESGVGKTDLALCLALVQ